MDESSAWRQWHEQRDEAARCWLIEHFDFIARRAARSIKGARPQDKDDLLAAARLGLVKAVDTWSPDSPMKAEPFIYCKSRYSAIDQVRAMSWVGKSTRNHVKRLEAAEAALTAQLQGRPPTEAELAQHMGLDVDGLAALRSKVVATSWNLGSLDDLKPGEEAANMAELVPDPGTPDPLVSALKAEEAEVLHRLIARLEQPHRGVLNARYFDGLPQQEIAGRLNYHPSRVTQIIQSARATIREMASQQVLDL